MYGKRKYSRISKPVEKPVDPTSIPNFVCPHCGQVKTINMSHIDITALDNGKLFMYAKMCMPCALLLQQWMKK